MNYKRINTMIYLGLMLIILVIFNGCIYRGTPEITLLIENQSGEILTIYDEYSLIGNVNSNETIQYLSSLATGKWLINAKNAQGEIVFSKKFAFEELQKIDDRTYKAIIPPFPNNSINSENTTSN
ncbi:MAG: hypothetical protein A2Z15_02910 [Chloroflexi bacterium RBG_16_50_11]|nr:MAG: hypothetical protein A2Z15_02910 [Chloroflexi bacterium RBG_16_50_11]